MSEYRPRFVVYLRFLALGLAVGGVAAPLYAGTPVAKPGVPTEKTEAMAPFIAETAAPAKRQGMVSAGGLNWLCQGSRCTASAAPALFGIKSCQDAAREVGRIRSFASAKKTLSAAELSQCNAAVTTGPAQPGAPQTVTPTQPTPPARFQPVNVTTAALSLTGARFEPVSLSTATLLLEGRQFQPVSLQTQRLEITGNRFEPVAVRTGELVLTGTRFVPVAFTTPQLVLEGVR